MRRGEFCEQLEFKLSELCEESVNLEISDISGY